ncbi:hypothetical protein AABB24_018403 [Solanum stoloniferum]|uniref:Uncharacterized protein n=2 Tax=Solanum TaxID=4107 RepID=A0AAF0UWM5_SOLVR|nr:uncharacterized protein LOC125809141 [Solanum verrucosum]WMV54037.1 hypothetical protein MTR67_047422 [Solanum verrucosum]
MERSEPALVPEWLRSTGSVTGGGSSSPHFATSSLHSDVTLSTLSSRNRSPRSVSDKDSPRSVFLDRSSSSNSRRSSSGTSSKHPYSSFNRNHRDKNREREKERPGTVDLWDHDTSDPLGNILAGRVDKNSLRRSQSLVSRKPGEFLSRRTEDSKGGISSTHSSGNGIHSGGSSTFNGNQKAAFEKDFPSLGIEERQVTRVSSPGLSSAVQSLPIGNSALLGADKWTSALAEVPPIIGSIGMGSSASQQSVAVAPTPSALSGTASLNMAEALSQAPPRTRSTMQIPDKTQRLEELAIKQSRQLIPVIPSMPKVSVSSSADKSKQPKSIARTNEMVGITKSMQQPFSSQLANQARSGQVRAETPATSHGKTLLVLKSGRENGVTSLSKEASTPANNTGNKLANCPPAVAPSAPAVTSPTSRVTSLETKAAALSLKPRSTAEKRSSLSQAQSRSDFFNLMRKKTSNSSTALPDSGMASSNSREQSCLKTKDEDSASLSPCVSENGSERTSNGDPHEAQNHVQRHNDVEENNSPINGSVYPDEKEAAFLRSLGWDENAVEEEGLTEEEINAFYQEYMKLKPSLKVYKGAQPKCLMLPELHLATNPGTASSNSTSSESDA